MPRAGRCRTASTRWQTRCRSRWAPAVRGPWGRVGNTRLAVGCYPRGTAPNSALACRGKPRRTQGAAAQQAPSAAGGACMRLPIVAARSACMPTAADHASGVAAVCPAGRNVVLEQSYGVPQVTSAGVRARPARPASRPAWVVPPAARCPAPPCSTGRLHAACGCCPADSCTTHQLPAQVINDGVSIARAIELEDPVENAGGCAALFPPPVASPPASTDLTSCLCCASCLTCQSPVDNTPQQAGGGSGGRGWLSQPAVCVTQQWPADQTCMATGRRSLQAPS